MQQGRGVDELDAGGQGLVVLAAIAAHPRRRQGQDRPQALAAGGDDMAGELRDQRHRRLHLLQDDLVDPRHIGIDQRGETLQGVRLTAGAFRVEVHDYCQSDTKSCAKLWFQAAA